MERQVMVSLRPWQNLKVVPSPWVQKVQTFSLILLVFVGLC